MAAPRIARNAPGRNLIPVIPPSSGTVRDPAHSGPGKRHTRSRPTPHLTPGQYARLLAFIDDGCVATLDGIARALPDVAQPVSAVFDLCDAGILNVDWESPFDGDLHVWRIDA